MYFWTSCLDTISINFIHIVTSIHEMFGFTLLHHACSETALQIFSSLSSSCCQLEPGDLRGPVGGGAGGQRAGAPGAGAQRHPAHQHHARQDQIQVQYNAVQYSTVQ